MKKLLLTLILLACPCFAGAPTYQTVGQGSHNAASPLTFGLTVNAGANGASFVWCVVNGSTTITGVTSDLDGAYTYVDMMQVPGYDRLYLYKFVSPTVGAHTISAAHSTTSNVGCGAITYTGVDQSTPLGSTQKKTTIGHALSDTYSSSATQVVMAGLAAANGPDVTSDGGQNSRIEQIMASSRTIAVDDKAGAASVTEGWTWTGDVDCGMMMVGVNGAADAAKHRRMLLGVGH